MENDLLTKKMSDSLLFVDQFITYKESELAKFPYRYNLLDELTINENTHSKFLEKLLKYKKNNEEFALKSLISFLGDFGFNFDFEPTNSTITSEKHRIDILIQKKGSYAIIIENKIHFAVDQERQIQKYIEKCHELGYANDNIYILYLTKQGGEPSENSFPTKERELFHGRYLNISYQQHILPWLDKFNQTLHSEEILKSGIIQYEDYLRHWIEHNKYYETMNENIRNYLITELGLGEGLEQSTELLNNKINDLEDTKIKLIETKNLLIREVKFKEYKEILKSKYPNNLLLEEISYPFEQLGVFFIFKGIKFTVHIEDNLTGYVYFGVGRHFCTETKNNSLHEILNQILSSSNFSLSDWWYGWKYSTYDTVIDDLTNLINEISRIDGVEICKN